jgi:hypothetical protein
VDAITHGQAIDKLLARRQRADEVLNLAGVELKAGFGHGIGIQ